MKLLVGNFKGPQGERGEEGPKGNPGETGQRGSRITSGTAITGTSTIGMKFPDTGIADAQMYDHYINTQTGNLYECTVAGTADMAEWVYVGNIKGPTGATGPAGSISDINDQKPTYEEAAKLENINSGEMVRITFGKIKKAISVLMSHYIQKATASILGHVKLSSSTAITIEGEYALDAREKNPSIAGTLAHSIGQINSDLDKIKDFTTYTIRYATQHYDNTNGNNYVDYILKEGILPAYPACIANISYWTGDNDFYVKCTEKVNDTTLRIRLSKPLAGNFTVSLLFKTKL